MVRRSEFLDDAIAERRRREKVGRCITNNGSVLPVAHGDRRRTRHACGTHVRRLRHWPPVDDRRRKLVGPCKIKVIARRRVSPRSCDSKLFGLDTAAARFFAAATYAGTSRRRSRHSRGSWPSRCLADAKGIRRLEAKAGKVIRDKNYSEFPRTNGISCASLYVGRR